VCTALHATQSTEAATPHTAFTFAPARRTGDTCVLDGDPPYWRILGRTSVDIIKSAGYKISALGIENVLLAHPAVAECAVVGLPDDALGERVAAVVACKDAPVSAPLPPGASARRPARPPGEDTRGATWRDSVPPHAPHVGSEPPRQRPGYPASSHAPHVRCQPPRQRCFRAAAMHRLHEQQMASLATCVLET